VERAPFIIPFSGLEKKRTRAIPDIRNHPADGGKTFPRTNFPAAKNIPQRIRTQPISDRTRIEFITLKALKRCAIVSCTAPMTKHTYMMMFWLVSAKLLIFPITRLFKKGSSAICSAPNQVPVIAPQTIVAELKRYIRKNGLKDTFLNFCLTRNVTVRNNSPYPASPINIAKNKLKKTRKTKLMSNSLYPGSVFMN